MNLVKWSEVKPTCRVGVRVQAETNSIYNHLSMIFYDLIRRCTLHLKEFQAHVSLEHPSLKQRFRKVLLMTCAICIYLLESYGKSQSLMCTHHTNIYQLTIINGNKWAMFMPAMPAMRQLPFPSLASQAVSNEIPPACGRRGGRRARHRRCRWHWISTSIPNIIIIIKIIS